MATMNNATTTASQRRSVTITLAAILYYWFGLAFLISSLLIVISALRNGELPVVFGIEMLSGLFSQRLGLDAAIAATVPWGVVNVLELVTGYWLWKSRKNGGKLGLVLFPAGMIFWIGYALPIMVVIGPLRVLLLAMGWKTLR
jgi:hypothetical protein